MHFSAMTFYRLGSEGVKANAADGKESSAW